MASCARPTTKCWGSQRMMSNCFRMPLPICKGHDPYIRCARCRNIVRTHARVDRNDPIQCACVIVRARMSIAQGRTQRPERVATHHTSLCVVDRESPYTCLVRPSVRRGAHVCACVTRTIDRPQSTLVCQEGERYPAKYRPVERDYRWSAGYGERVGV